MDTAGNHRARQCLFFGALTSALLARLLLFDFESVDYQFFLSRWYDHFIAEGRFAGLGNMDVKFYNYSPLSMTLISLSTYLPIPKLYAIKALSVSFDFIAMALFYLIVRALGQSRETSTAAAIVMFSLPTVVINGSMWGQCDMMYTACFLWSFLAIVRKQPAMCLVAFGFAASLKPQALFWTPVLAGLFFAGKLPWRLFYLPFYVYAVCGLPEILAGRSWIDVMLHWAKVENMPGLTLNAANWYQWIPDNSPAPFAWLGMALTIVFSSAIAWRVARIEGELEKPKRLLPLVMLSLLLPPFLLPGMHERYFFPADVFSILYAVHTPRGWWLVVCMQLVSAGSYLPFLLNITPIPLWLLAIILYGAICFVGAQARRRIALNETGNERVQTT
jgi:Gpi18-like mannosyltransferase